MRITLCTLGDGEYELSQFRGSDRILSPTFPDIELTVEEIFQANAS